MTDAALEATDIVKVLGEGAGEVLALKGVSLSLACGELTLLMGPSGSGKTTLLSVLGCMLTPTRGAVRVRGLSTEGAGPEALAKLRRDHIGFVFQSYHLFPTLTAVDNVRLAMDVRGERPQAAIAKAKDALATVGLAHKINSYPRELSGGEQQRVAIARAIAGDATAILADEPTAALDSENGHAVMEILAQIAKDSTRAVLVVTHDPRILPFANRIVRIEDGCIVGAERSDVRGEARNQIRDEMRNELRNEVRDEIRNDVRSEILSEILGAVHNKIRNEVCSVVRSEESSEDNSAILDPAKRKRMQR